MPIVAIIGPFRPTHTDRWPLISPGIRWWQRWRNIARAKAAAREVWELGAVAYCPHAMTAGLDGVIPDDVIMPGLLELCARCDAGRVLRGWEHSEGSLDEMAALETPGKPVFHTVDQLRKWLAS